MVIVTTVYMVMVSGVNTSKSSSVYINYIQLFFFCVCQSCLNKNNLKTSKDTNFNTKNELTLKVCFFPMYKSSIHA